MIILWVIIAGLLSTVSPCVLPMLPIIVSSAFRSSPKGPLMVSAGFVISFVALGAVVSSLDGVIYIDQDLIRIFGAVMLLLVGILYLCADRAVIGTFSAGIMNRAAKLQSGTILNPLLGQLLVGLGLGLVWSPCIGPALGSLMGMMAVAESRPRAIVLLVVFALSATTPILIFAYGAKGLSNRFKLWSARWVPRLQKTFGWILIIIGISVMLGLDKSIEVFITTHMPDAWSEMLANH